MGAEAVERQMQTIIGLCRRDVGVAELRDQVLRRLRVLVPVDAAFFATVDPATLLFTGAAADEPLGAATALFMDNEFGQADLNKFSALAASPQPVNSLDRATTGCRQTSPRYREIMAPMALGDELRAALVSGGCCWGVMCLHREDSPAGFSDGELRLVARLVPHLAEGVRRAMLVERADPEAVDTTVGVLILDDDLGLVSCNREGEYWLSQLGVDTHVEGLPLPVYAVARQAALASPDGAPGRAARVRVRTTTGQWLVVHASRLCGTPRPQTAVVIEPPQPNELASLVLDAHGITPAQSRVAALVLQGRSTRQIVNELAISSNTVQEHLRAVFDRFGVGSRRELVAALLSPPQR